FVGRVARLVEVDDPLAGVELHAEHRRWSARGRHGALRVSAGRRTRGRVLLDRRGLPIALRLRRRAVALLLLRRTIALLRRRAIPLLGLRLLLRITLLRLTIALLLRRRAVPLRGTAGRPPSSLRIAHLRSSSKHPR